MNERTQAGTILKTLRTKYAEATTDLDRKKIAFVAKTIKALIQPQTGATT